MKLEITGGEPLVGSVKVSGSKISAVHIIIASLFSNEDIVIDNVPRVEDITSLLSIIESLGAKVEWLSTNQLKVNGSTISSNVISFDPAISNVGFVLVSVPVIYRFGKAKITKVEDNSPKQHIRNRFLSVWESLQFEIKEEGEYYQVESKSPLNAEIILKVNTVTGTANAILSSIFIPDETVISNASSEPEIDDLIKFVNAIGGAVRRVDERKLIVAGTSSFSGGRFEIMPDHAEAVFFASLALATFGDITIEGVVSGNLLAFARKLESIGANFEFKEEVFKVWRPKGSKLSATNMETAPCPGFLSDWQPSVTVLLTQAEGTSYVTENIHLKRLEFTRELNRMGGNIELSSPSEDQVQAKIEGPSPLKKGKLSVSDPITGPALILAALIAEGRSEILNYEQVRNGYEHFDERLLSLGAKIKVS